MTPPSPAGLVKLFEASGEVLSGLVPGFALEPRFVPPPPPEPRQVAAGDGWEDEAEDWEDEAEEDWEDEAEEGWEDEEETNCRFWAGVGRAVVGEVWGPGDEEGVWTQEAWEDEAEETWNERPDLGEVAEGVANALLSFPWTSAQMEWAVGVALAERGAWIRKLVQRLGAEFGEPPSWDELSRFLALDRGLRWHFHRGRLRIEVAFLPPEAPRAPVPEFSVPTIETHRGLADWLEIGASDLEWLADTQGWLVREPPGPLQHYHYHWLPKRSGGRRLVEAPKDLLKRVQRQLLRQALNHVPPHEAAHGFCRGRSITSFASPHCGQDLVLRMDLRDFFPSVGGGRVFAIFRALGYSSPVAQALTDLTTTRTPDRVLRGSGLGVVAEERLRLRHLPQGAPTSPALANLAAYRLDLRLRAAARAVGASYTRYADDLAFSGGAGFRRKATGFRKLVERVVKGEGFRINRKKNRWMRPHVRQRLAGLVVNEQPRPSRESYDLLKATLYNCTQCDPHSQNRGGHPEFQAHLRGRVAWFLQADPRRGERLRTLFEKIDWAE